MGVGAGWLVCAFPFWVRLGFAVLKKKKKGRVECDGKKKTKGGFWRAKASLFGRESVAAFLVGDLGCAYRDQDRADFRLDAAAPRPPDLSVSSRTSPPSQPLCLSCSPCLLVSRHCLLCSRLVTRHSSSVTRHNWTTSPASVPAPKPTSFRPCPVGRAGTCRQGPSEGPASLIANCG